MFLEFCLKDALSLSLDTVHQRGYFIAQKLIIRLINYTKGFFG